MRVLVTGGYGFIGSAICARLVADGHEVVAAGRKIKWAQKRFPALQWVFCDFNTDTDPDIWRERLAGVDAVVNCVGVLQDGGNDSTQNAHVTGLQALLAACEMADVRKFIHFSAIGADIEAGTKYARSKYDGAKLVKQSKLDWLIVEPSLVLDRNVYGGSALIRTLAGLPMLIPLVYGATRFQPVHMQDVTKIVSQLLRDDAPSQTQVEIAGPDSLSLQEIVALVRNWLGFGKAKFVNVPAWLAAPIFVVGDLLGVLGIRNALRSTAKRQMQYDVGGDPGQIEQLIGYKTRSITTIFNSDPASIGDRFHARAGLFLPLSRIVLALYWIFSGLIPLAISKQASFDMMAAAGLPQTSHWFIWLFGSLADITLGALLLFGIRVRLVCLAMILLTFAYIAGISLTLPGLWLDPLAVVLKVFPMMALAAVIAMVETER
ncbi:hypothetical protein MNBD_ALPHA06-1582 [hydrothermal vent metagenome]|uniref:NAD(P)-binding domain-containing protein n=1 Tax=hydrothermal vent metagenome TaxID=652676 RepID=A0A3B0S9H1_9ZZZZ